MESKSNFLLLLAPQKYSLIIIQPEKGGIKMSQNLPSLKNLNKHIHNLQQNKILLEPLIWIKLGR